MTLKEAYESNQIYEYLQTYSDSIQVKKDLDELIRYKEVETMRASSKFNLIILKNNFTQVIDNLYNGLLDEEDYDNIMTVEDIKNHIAREEVICDL